MASHEPVAVPYTEVSADALQGIIESFVLREGTDYGRNEFSLEQKVAHVMGQIARGEARIMFDPDSETVTIVSGSAATGCAETGSAPPRGRR